MSTALLLLTVFLAAPPEPVTGVGGLWNSDGSITLNWILPADPSVTGLRIVRERLDAVNEIVYDLPTLATSFTDTTTTREASYRFWIQTQDAGGQLSSARFIDFISDGDGFAHSHWFCWGSTGAAGTPRAPLLAAALALGWSFRRRRG